jgi:Prolyl oligopeptidase family.
VSDYEDLGLKSYKDVLGAYDFLKKIGFESNSIGLHGISLGAVPAIFAANEEKDIKAIWADSSLAEFSMVLKDEIARYGLSIEFGPAVSFFGKLLSGVDPINLNPAKKLTSDQNYFFTHGDKDQRMLVRHFDYFKKYSEENNIKSKFWLAENSYHVDGMFKYPDLYAKKMKDFFEDNLK